MAYVPGGKVNLSLKFAPSECHLSVSLGPSSQRLEKESSESNVASSTLKSWNTTLKGRLVPLVERFGILATRQSILSNSVL